MSIIDSVSLIGEIWGINEVHGAWHIASIATAAAAITTSFTIIGKYQQKNGARTQTGY